MPREIKKPEADVELRVCPGEAQDEFQDDPHDHDPDDGPRLLNIEDYWAGRTLAARRSARAAA